MKFKVVKTKQIIDSIKQRSLREFLSKNWLFILIFFLASLMRLWDLSARAIFFDDAAFDMWAGVRALSDKNLPLLGIPSSLPRFHQGPVTVWLNMFLSAFFDFNLFPFSLFFVGLALLAVLLVYFFCEKYLSKGLGLVAIFLIALSPFAIAQARMPYHTNPIPLATILYLFSLIRLWQKKQHGLFWAVLGWAFLFQFELAVFPTFILIPYILLRTKNFQNWQKKVKLVGAGLVIGLWPQIIFDFKNNFSQLGLFITWVGYRTVGVFSGEHQMNGTKIKSVSDAFIRYGGRIWSVDFNLVGLFFWSIVLYAFYRLFLDWRKNKLKPGLEISGAFTLILTLGYLIHGSPSEAYFPPFIILLPILASFSLIKIFEKKKLILIGFLLIWGMSNIWMIFTSNFFVSNLEGYTYHYGVTEQKKIVEFINNQSEGDFVLKTTGEHQRFASTFDSLRWLGAQKNIKENKDSKNVFYIEGKSSVLQTDSSLKVEYFKSVDIYYE